MQITKVKLSELMYPITRKVINYVKTEYSL